MRDIAEIVRSQIELMKEVEKQKIKYQQNKNERTKQYIELLNGEIAKLEKEEETLRSETITTKMLSRMVRIRTSSKSFPAGVSASNIIIYNVFRQLLSGGLFCELFFTEAAIVNIRASRF